MELRISGEPKEIADLIAALQDRQSQVIFSARLDVPDCSPSDLVVENGKYWQGKTSA